MAKFFRQRRNQIVAGYRIVVKKVDAVHYRMSLQDVSASEASPWGLKVNAVRSRSAADKMTDYAKNYGASPSTLAKIRAEGTSGAPRLYERVTLYLPGDVMSKLRAMESVKPGDGLSTEKLSEVVGRILTSAVS